VRAGSFLTVPVYRLPTLSPSGARLAYVEHRPDLYRDAYVSTLYLAAATGADAGTVRATFGGPVTTLVFAAEDHLLVAVGDQLWRVRGDEPAEEIWKTDGAIVRVSPRLGGDQLLVSVLAKLDHPEAPRRVRTARHKADGRGALPEVADGVWLVAPGAGGRKATAERVGHTDDDYRHAEWSPDGRTAVAIAHRFDEEMHRSRLVEISADGREMREISPVADIWTYAWKPGGDGVVWAARTTEPGAYAPYRLFECAPGGAPQAWADTGETLMAPLVLCDWRWPSLRTPFLVAPDGGSVLTVTQDGAAVRARRYGRDGSVATFLGEGRAIVGDLCSDRAGSRFAYVMSTPTTLDDVFVHDAAGSRRVTDVMKAWPDGAACAAPEFFTVRAPDGGESECAYLAPERTEGPAPMVLVVHGGPHGAWGDNLYLEHHILREMGFGVLWVNPRGSSGYGVAFAHQVIGHWGDGDMSDLLAAVDRMVAAGRADPKRLAIMGTSYGGFMSSWVIGHDDRFRTAIVQAPLTNHISFFGTSDIGPFFVKHQLGVKGLETDLATMWHRSPLKYAPNVKCPVLLVCGENDDRCPIGQSEEYYTALREHGVKTEFLRYPGASHGLGSIAPPSHRLHRQQAVVDWLAEHVLDAPGPRNATAAPALATGDA
jgi:dipeptidyl aminopeptidase/acylaminoacyl peptidase